MTGIMRGSSLQVFTLLLIISVCLGVWDCPKKIDEKLKQCGVVMVTWTDWFSRDDPMDGVENEDLAGQVKNMSLMCQTSRLGAQCRVKNTDNYVVSGADTFGEVKLKFPWLCVPDRGLRCLNSEQDPGVTCPDFEIRYLCPDRLPYTGSMSSRQDD
ncbi:unnamed protein product [Owenia fusiformis]|uniref:Uncharacterized protein n=1 Tax=Owenia fusiformis TaxID=6347 RepID=A0A8J1Y089_OWEFU|nr:unnamed protein product [Owenia fusiformis]